MPEHPEQEEEFHQILRLEQLERQIQEEQVVQQRVVLEQTERQVLVEQV